jgi:Zn-dependent metalloprotease
MRIKSYRRPKRRFQFGSSLLRIIAATAVAGMTLAQIRDNPVEDFAGTLPGHESAEPERPCASTAGYPLAQNAEVQRNKADGSIRQLKGSDLSPALEQEKYFRTLQQGNRNEDIALCFLQAYRTSFKLHAPLKELQPVVASPDEQGYTHVRFRQLYAGMPVRDGEIVVHLTPDKKVYLVDGHYYPTPTELGTQAHLSADEATAVARDSFDWNTSAQRRYRTQGAVYIDGNHRAHLAYQVTTYGTQGNDWEIWLDANTGEILTKFLLKSHS